jgi:predicted dehydrogenase
VTTNGRRHVQRTGVAVVGVGYWGRNYMRIFGELADARVTMMCDQRIEALASVGHHFPHVIATSHFDDVLESPDVQAVVICTQASTHYDLASRALAAGKDVLVEKPFTTRSSEAEMLVAEAAAADRLLLVGHTFIYNPGIQAVKEHMERLVLGRIYYLYARRTNLGPIRNDVNASWDLASHDVAIFNYLLDGVPEWVSAVGIDVLGAGHEDAAFISMGYADGVVAHIHASWAEPNKVREVVVVGSDSRLAFDDLNPNERVRIYEKGVKASQPRISGFGEHHFAIQDGAIVSPVVPPREPLKSLCGHFLHCIRRGERPLTPGRDGIAVVQTMETIDMSIALGGAPVQVSTAMTSQPTRGEVDLDPVR